MADQSGDTNEQVRQHVKTLLRQLTARQRAQNSQEIPILALVAELKREQQPSALISGVQPPA
jgi:hypothetical protein